SQSIILWDYLRLAFFPRPAGFGPFHDDYHVYSMGFPAAIAALCWGLAFVIAWCLRKKTVLPMFALLWFFCAHLIESSVIPLELYFEHRNYLATVGPLFALVMTLWQWGEKYGRVRLVGLGLLAYGSIMAGVLFQITSLFGDPELAAEMWYIEHPGSTRASQYLAQQYVKKNDVHAALRILDESAANSSNSGALRLQGLQLACVLNKPQDELKQRMEQVLDELPMAPRRFSIMSTLGVLKTQNESMGCGGFIQKNHLELIALAALNSPGISSSAIERSNLHVFIALQSIGDRDLGKTMHHLVAALEAFPQVPTLKLTAAVLKSAGISEEMRSILETHQPKWPRSPWLRVRLQQEWSEISKLIMPDSGAS